MTARLETETEKETVVSDTKQKQNTDTSGQSGCELAVHACADDIDSRKASTRPQPVCSPHEQCTLLSASRGASRGAHIKMPVVVQQCSSTTSSSISGSTQYALGFHSRADLCRPTDQASCLFYSARQAAASCHFSSSIAYSKYFRQTNRQWQEQLHSRELWKPNLRN